MFTEVITEQKDAKEALIRAKEQAEQAAMQSRNSCPP
jgi:hypothetical protein